MEVVGWPWGRRPGTKSSEGAERRRRFALPPSTPSLGAAVTGQHRSMPSTVLGRRGVVIYVKPRGGVVGWPHKHLHYQQSDTIHMHMHPRTFG